MKGSPHGLTLFAATKIYHNKKIFSVTNTLAYFAGVYMMKKKN
jgi:hypothetical protein